MASAGPGHRLKKTAQIPRGDQNSNVLSESYYISNSDSNILSESYYFVGAMYHSSSTLL